MGIWERFSVVASDSIRQSLELDVNLAMKTTRQSPRNQKSVNYYPTGHTLTRGRRIANQRRSARIAAIRRRERQHALHVSGGITKRDFDRLPERRVTKTNIRQLSHICCAICMAAFRTDRILKVGVDCNHPFHSSCLERWLRHSNMSSLSFVSSLRPTKT